MKTQRASVLKLILGMFMFLLASQLAAQQGPTATPAPISLATEVPQATEAGPAFNLTTAEPTSSAQVFLEALDLANVRAQPDTSASQLGTIRAGTQYAVIGRYFEWLQFQFPSSPTGTGWVFGQLVTVTGNLASIPEFDPATAPTADPLAAQSTATQAALTQTPGGILTATAFERFLAQEGPIGTLAPGQALPTFTYPAEVSLVTPTPDAQQATETPLEAQTVLNVQGRDGIAPIVPILALAALGILGILVSAVRK
jgi:uncharacterized protein YraI